MISNAKKRFKDTHGSLYCEACSFDFEKFCGERGADFIEAHHTIPVSEMEPGQETSINDIALVCSNCHSILHRTRPWMTISDLKISLRGRNVIDA